MKIKIALLAGGKSGEKEISINTGKEIAGALDKKKYEVFSYDPGTKLKEFINDCLNKKFDLVFPALHGPFGEDGKIQGMLDMFEVPYLFSDCLASALAMNKYMTKVLAREVGLNIAEEVILDKDDPYNAKGIIEVLGAPIVVKPLELGSSVGVSIAYNEEELEKGIKDAFKHDSKIMLEKFVDGKELSVGVMGSGKNAKALPVIEIKPKVSNWFDYRAKYETGGSEEICPADIPEVTRDKAKKMAIEIFTEIGCRDLARADFIWNKFDHKLYFLEINTIPGMTVTSLVPQEAKAAGMEFPEFLDKLISGAIKRN